MPELPDIVVYLESLNSRIVGNRLERIDVRGVSVLRSFDPPLDAAYGRQVVGTSRMGKRIVIHLEEDLFFVLHLMIAGRLNWKEDHVKLGRDGQMAMYFERGMLLLREVAKKKRARVWLHRGEAELLAVHHRKGVEPLETTRREFVRLMQSENRTLKRALTDPSKLSGIGNAYSDEILFRAKLSPIKQTRRLSEEELGRCYDAMRATLEDWLDRLRHEVGDGWPKKVTAFRSEMFVHGRYGEPCRECRTPIQRIVYAENELNYCPQCQTGGKLLADRSLSRLLKGDWPKTVEEMEDLLP